MYKTVRHGENSLQYTILPQNDDARCSDRRGSYKTSRKKAVLAYIGVTFLCTILIGGIIVTLMMTTQLVPNTPPWFFITSKSNPMVRIHHHRALDQKLNGTTAVVLQAAASTATTIIAKTSATITTTVPTTALLTPVLEQKSHPVNPAGLHNTAFNREIASSTPSTSSTTAGFRIILTKALTEENSPTSTLNEMAKVASVDTDAAVRPPPIAYTTTQNNIVTTPKLLIAMPFTPPPPPPPPPPPAFLLTTARNPSQSEIGNVFETSRIVPEMHNMNAWLSNEWTPRKMINWIGVDSQILLALLGILLLVILFTLAMCKLKCRYQKVNCCCRILCCCFLCSGNGRSPHKLRREIDTGDGDDNGDSATLLANDSLPEDE